MQLRLRGGLLGGGHVGAALQVLALLGLLLQRLLGLLQAGHHLGLRLRSLRHLAQQRHQARPQVPQLLPQLRLRLPQPAPQRVHLRVHRALGLQLRHLRALPLQGVLQVVAPPADVLLAALQAPQPRVVALRPQSRLVLPQAPHQGVQVRPSPGQGLGLLLQARDGLAGVRDPGLVLGGVQGGLLQGPLGRSHTLLRVGVPLPLFPLRLRELGGLRVQLGAQRLHRGLVRLLQPLLQLRLPGAQQLRRRHGLPHVLAELAGGIDAGMVLRLALGQVGSGLLHLLITLHYGALIELPGLLFELRERLAEDVLALLSHGVCRFLSIPLAPADQTLQLGHPDAAALVLGQIHLRLLELLAHGAQLAIQPFQLR
mmetsp:Transcript_133953/g.317636  ORF Transcript_133953/g.317636 Transcript_133953/m.317636 type:complete len:370 (+) Transcript_133953:2247-3356(+)